MDLVYHGGNTYPKFTAEGFAAQYAFPFAIKILDPQNKTGYDIGCNRPAWCLPGAIPIDPMMNEYDAMNLPNGQVDYIFSSHCLEHLDNWVKVLDYWTTKIKSGGHIYLYLPHYDQTYWRSWSNRKHIHNLKAEEIAQYFKDSGEWSHVEYTTGHDLNYSFTVVATKK